MKRIPSAMCGLMMLLPLSAVSIYAQTTSTTHSSTTPKATNPSKPSQTPSAPSTASSAAASSPADPNAPAPPAHPITAEQTREILDLMAYKKMEDQGWTQLISNNKQRAPFIPQDVWTDVMSGLGGIDYVAIMQPVYAKYLSTEDAAKAIEFYRTPAGKHVLQSMAPILGESVAVTQQKGQQVGREAIEKHRAEIEEAQKKYQAEHAPVGGGPTLGPGGPPSGAGAPGPGASGPGATGAGTSGAGTSGAGAGNTTPAPSSPSGSPSSKPSSPSGTPPPPQR